MFLGSSLSLIFSSVILVNLLMFWNIDETLGKVRVCIFGLLTFGSLVSVL